MSTVLKSSFNLTLASYIIIIIFNQLQAWFQSRILQPRIERNIVQVPEAFMTTVIIYSAVIVQDLSIEFCPHVSRRLLSIEDIH